MEKLLYNESVISVRPGGRKRRQRHADTPEELHKTYIANTEAFYKVAGRGLAQELDEFVVSCALGLWKGSPRLGQQHVDAVNQL